MRFVVWAQDDDNCTILRTGSGTAGVEAINSQAAIEQVAKQTGKHTFVVVPHDAVEVVDVITTRTLKHKAVYRKKAQ